ncbi:1-acyl-sn-glycerol-3-phosphate acyltransferase [Pseudomonas sp. NFACC02]|uniref:lysophospholipid acyltransferase family protein n=1 Tax=Pseudomonas sp. NFACC02 TaxID=1566250 RepID=UPI0008AC81C7|nr:lysophospholipid acyltransferase family protein [Pseudomonas sp. NFACC02]SER47043.1 1-acyl-sn-glycerol-3-phosphate acyltransferase [Pseudomonas sp. NFACC02]
MSSLRSHARVIRVLWVIGLGLTIAGTFALMERVRVGHSMARRQRWTSWFMARLTAALPFRVTVSGTLPVQPALWVSNHVSWTDIPLLGMLAPLSFLSKAEVRTWPVAGWLALKAGTLFIRRGSGDSKLIQKQMGQHLLGNHSLVIFPEGTTTDGTHLRTFHGRLLSSAIETGVPVQPVAIRYVRDGNPDHIAPFIGDDDLLSHLRRLFANEVSDVHIQLLEPIASQGKERAALAFEAQTAVQTALFGQVAQPDELRASTARAA